MDNLLSTVLIVLLSRPANAGWRRVDLLTWPRIGGAKSANEVAQIINEKNNSLKEGVARKAGLKQNAKSY